MAKPTGGPEPAEVEHRCLRDATEEWWGMSNCVHFHASEMPREVIRGKAATSTTGIIIEQRGLSKDQIKTIARGSLSAYSPTWGNAKDATTNIVDDAPSSGGLGDWKIGRRSIAGCGTEHY